MPKAKETRTDVPLQIADAAASPLSSMAKKLRTRHYHCKRMLGAAQASAEDARTTSESLETTHELANQGAKVPTCKPCWQRRLPR